MKEKKLTVQQNMLYNSIGSFAYLICQWLITVLVVRLSDYESAGNLSLAMSISNMFFPLASFGIRSFQVSDLQDEYTAGDYVRTRFLTCGVSLLAFGVYVLINGHYSFEQIVCLSIYMVFRLSEALVDVLQGIDQKAQRMDIIGVSGVLRGILSLVVFCVTLVITQALAWAILAMGIATYAVVLLYDWPRAHQLTPFGGALDRKKILRLLGQCWPLMLNSIFLTSVVSIPRNNLEWICSATVLGYYSSVATPAVIVQTASSWLYNPLILPLTTYYQNREKQPFLLLIGKVLIALIGVFILIIAGAALLGRWALQLLFGSAILPYAYLLIPVLITTMMIALSWFLGTLLIIARRLKTLLLANAVAMGISIALSAPLIRQFQMDGVNYVVYLAMGVSLVIQIAVLWWKCSRHFANQ